MKTTLRKESNPLGIDPHEFNNYFEFKIAHETEDFNEIKKFRYNIFVKELKYNLPSNPVEKTESDRFDKNAIHCLIRHRRTGLTAGYLRLIIPNNGEGSISNTLPIESEYKTEFYEEKLKPSSLPTDSICEASRISVSKIFRTPSIYKNMDFTTDEKKYFPIITASLFACSYAIADLCNRNNMFAIMEPSLPRLLRLSGFNFTKVGKDILIFGQRSPYHIDRTMADSGATNIITLLYNEIKSEISQQIITTGKNPISKQKKNPYI